jgi:hypothetical protein
MKTYMEGISYRGRFGVLQMEGLHQYNTTILYNACPAHKRRQFVLVYI